MSRPDPSGQFDQVKRKNQEMKKLIVILSLLIIYSADIISQEYWIKLPSPTTRWLTKCSLVDTLYGWAAGDSGTIIRTSNGGVNWSVQNSGILAYHIDDIFFLNRNLGWALANDYLFNGTFVLKTTNGGNTWTTSRFPDTAAVVGNVYFIDSLNGFVSGFSGKIFKTTNSGGNWSECTIDTAFCPYLYLFPKNKIKFLNSQTGFAAGGHMDLQGILWKTTNAGLHWFTYCVAPEPLFDIKAISGNRVISTGGDFEYGASICNSYDGGNNWLYEATGVYGQGTYLAFRTPEELWVPLSFAQTWAVNLDSGNYHTAWLQIQAPESTSVYAAGFVTPTYGLAFGSNGSIMKYNSAVIGVGNNQNQVPLRSTLHQNYPNPFNPSTVISYDLIKATFVKITIYDLLGKQLNVFIEGYKPAGGHNFKFRDLGLASGVYIYRLEAGDFTESRKMVLIK
jgi:photosystem II stability/assembly factor-like uncharacterized protein